MHTHSLRAWIAFPLLGLVLVLGLGVSGPPVARATEAGAPRDTDAVDPGINRMPAAILDVFLSIGSATAATAMIAWVDAPDMINYVSVIATGIPVALLYFGLRRRKTKQRALAQATIRQPKCKP